MKNRKLIAVCLYFVMLLSFIGVTPREVQATTNSSYYYMETVDNTILRASPYKKGSIVAQLPAETLVCVVGSVRNSYGNSWYLVTYFDQLTYCYSEHLTSHEHNFINESINDSQNKVCECGELSSSGIEQSFAITIPSSILLEVGITVLATVIYAKRNDIADAVGDLVYVTEDLIDAVGIYGIRYIESKGILIPIRINTAGIAVSVTLEEFESHMKSQNEDDLDGEKKYYPAMLIANANGSDSILVPDFKDSMNLEEACDYVDSTTSLSGAFGNYWNFSSDVHFCNIYTPEKTDAAALCKKVVSCGKNNIVTYGTSNPITGQGQSETNNNWNIIGTYEHYHMHDAFEKNHKACPHIFFGDMLNGVICSAASL